MFNETPDKALGSFIFVTQLEYAGIKDKAQFGPIAQHVKQEWGVKKWTPPAAALGSQTYLAGHKNTDSARRAAMATSPSQKHYGLRQFRAEASETNWKTAERRCKRQSMYKYHKKWKKKPKLNNSHELKLRWQKQERNRERHKNTKQ